MYRLAVYADTPEACTAFDKMAITCKPNTIMKAAVFAGYEIKEIQKLNTSVSLPAESHGAELLVYATKLSA